MRSVKTGDVCENGNCRHSASGVWVGKGGSLAITRDYMQSLWCKCCMLKAMIAYAEEAASRLESLRAELSAVSCNVEVAGQ